MAVTLTALPWRYRRFFWGLRRALLAEFPALLAGGRAGGYAGGYAGRWRLRWQLRWPLAVTLGVTLRVTALPWGYAGGYAGVPKYQRFSPISGGYAQRYSPKSLCWWLKIVIL